jgi:hypothetical protein
MGLAPDRKDALSIPIKWITHPPGWINMSDLNIFNSSLIYFHGALMTAKKRMERLKHVSIGKLEKAEQK